MIYLVVVLLIALAAAGFFIYRDLRNGAVQKAPVSTDLGQPSAPYKVEPVVTPTVTSAPVVDSAVIPITSQVPSTLAYYNPNRIVTDYKGAPNDWDGRSLKYDGLGPHLPEGSASLPVPNVPVGLLTLAIADVYGAPVTFVLRTADGRAIYKSSTPVAAEPRIQIVEAGDYTLDVTGGQCVVKVMSRGQ